MISVRSNSLDPLNMHEWRWMTFLDEIIKSIANLNPHPYPIPIEFLHKEEFFGPKQNIQKATTVTWAFTSEKIRQGRAACVYAGDRASVLNFVVSPFHNYDLPFFGADFVTLSSGHLLALDLQPALKDDWIHTNNVWSRLNPIHKKWQSLLPSGGPIPDEAKSFFSPGFLWSRIPLGVEGDKIISNILKPAFIDYLSLYLNLLDKASEVDEDRSIKLLQGQRLYMHYRAKKDPARGMLKSFYGSDWTEKYINRVLFDLK